MQNFYPRSPCGERQQAKALKVASLRISIHALLAESDNAQNRHLAKHPQFLSTLSLRRATVKVSIHFMHRKDFYPRSPCGERPNQRKIDQKSRSISIHALLAESDQTRLQVRHSWNISIHALLAESDASDSLSDTSEVISIHALLAESDALGYVRGCLFCVFLSTLSLRRATCDISLNYDVSLFLSTLSLRRATLFRQNYECFQWIISIHALLAESDL